MHRDHRAIFDAAAESLVLVCPDEPDTVAELVTRLQAIADWFGDQAHASHPAVRAVTLATRLAEGEDVDHSDLEAAYDEARALAEVSAEPASSASGGIAAHSAMPLAGDAELMKDFAVRASEHLDDADEQLLALETSPADSDAIDAVFRAFHTIKGMAGFLALDAISEHAHASESLLSAARSGASAVDAETVQALFGAVDVMRGMIAEATGIVSETRVPSDAPEPEVGPSESSDTAGAFSAPVASHGGSRAGTMRVDEARLDRLLDTIGELVIAESMVSSAVRGGDGVGATLQVERLDKITRELQSMATSLRMVPMRATFQRMTRLVRDLSHKSGKAIDFRIEGEDTELDKVVVDQIADPLIHALRNAVDHGIEGSDERTAAGKPKAGRITLRAFHAGGAIHIEISDDGRGLDSDRIAKRARERGLLGEGETPGDAALAELIFAPGFSTADEVTDVSGRGVGMDVVRRTIEELRGRIELTSEPGRGTTLSMRLPITLAIIDGMVARVGDERYVIPMLAIERSVRPTPEQLATVTGRGEMLALPEGMLPILRLHRLFSTPGAEQDPTQAVVIITSENGARAGLMACELLGQQQTVIKPLGDGLVEQPGITGGAIMPDGQVGLILDAAGLVRLAHDKGGA